MNKKENITGIIVIFVLISFLFGYKGINKIKGYYIDSTIKKEEEISYLKERLKVLQLKSEILETKVLMNNSNLQQLSVQCKIKMQEVWDKAYDQCVIDKI